MNSDTVLHVKGESVFVDDAVESKSALYVSVLCSDHAHALIKSIDYSEAEKMEGVAGIFTAKDIPGRNQIGGVIEDEVLLAENRVDFAGQPVLFIAAEKEEFAIRAKEAVKVHYEELEPVFDPREAAERGNFIAPVRTFVSGNIEHIWNECDFIAEGRADSGAQEHLYLETQSAFARPAHSGSVQIYSSTQSPSAVQRAAAGVLGLSMNEVEVDVARLGGAFGGKEDQATPWACMAAMAAFLLKKPVKLVLHRDDDIRITGKRHPYSSDFKIGLNKRGKILAYEVVFYQNSGACADLSTAVLERSMFHATNSYFIPNVKVTGMPCRTNMVPFTAFRGFGGPQAMFVIESAIACAADKMNMSVEYIQKKNLLREGDAFPYGMRVRGANSRKSFYRAEKIYEFAQRKKEIEEYNKKSVFNKKGISLMPVCFGISFTSTFLNQAGALVHIYTDGSVSVSTGAVEMGQGVNAKIRLIVSSLFGISERMVRIETTNTRRVANTSPTAASTAVDLNGKAAELACNELLKRLRKEVMLSELCDKSDIEFRETKIFVKGVEYMTWQELVKSSYFKRVNLSAQALYRTPGIFYDKKTEKGTPFRYHVFGTAITEVSLDCLRGTYSVDSVKIVHDSGKLLDREIDLGQVEGALVQGIGWMTMEDMFYKEGRPLADSLSTYKVPDIKTAPLNIETEFLEDSYNTKAVMGTKGVGEPPFMYGTGTYFALLNAMRSFRPERELFFSAPLTPEKVFDFLHLKDKQELST